MLRIIAREIAKAVSEAECRVELLLEGNVTHIIEPPVHRNPVLLRESPRLPEELGRYVHARYPEAPLPQWNRVPPGPTGDIQHGLARMNAELLLQKIQFFGRRRGCSLKPELDAEAAEKCLKPRRHGGRLLSGRKGFGGALRLVR